MSTHTTTTVKCPGMCGGAGCGENVQANWGTFKATTVKVSPCTRLLAQGWTGPQMVLRKGHADARLIPAHQATTWTHKDGLVSFAV